MYLNIPNTEEFEHPDQPKPFSMPRCGPKQKYSGGPNGAKCEFRWKAEGVMDGFSTKPECFCDACKKKDTIE